MLNNLSKKNKIAVIGAGVVGLAMGKILIRANLPITFVDTNPARLCELSEQKFNITNSLTEALAGAAFSLVCVPTPSRLEDGEFDGSAVLGVVTQIFRFLEKIPQKKRRANFHTIIVKSTVLPEFMEMLLALTQLRLGEDYGLVFNPEFLRSESSEQDVLYKQIVIGGIDSNSTKAAQRIYRIIEKNFGTEFHYLLTDFTTASLLKYKHNLWLAATMGYLMEFAGACRLYGADPDQVIKATPNPDPAVWVRDDFLKNGFLDECLPKDSLAFRQAARKKGAQLTILERAARVNQGVIHKKNLAYDIQRFKLLTLICRDKD